MLQVVSHCTHKPTTSWPVQQSCQVQQVAFRHQRTGVDDPHTDHGQVDRSSSTNSMAGTDDSEVDVDLDDIPVGNGNMTGVKCNPC